MYCQDALHHVIFNAYYVYNRNVSTLVDPMVPNSMRAACVSDHGSGVNRGTKCTHLSGSLQMNSRNALKVQSLSLELSYES